MRPSRNRVVPDLLANRWIVLHGPQPGRRRVEDQRALAGDQRAVVGGVVPAIDVSWKERRYLTGVIEHLPDIVRLHRDIALGVHQFGAETAEQRSDPEGGITARRYG